MNIYQKSPYVPRNFVLVNNQSPVKNDLSHIGHLKMRSLIWWKKYLQKKQVVWDEDNDFGTKKVEKPE